LRKRRMRKPSFETPFPSCSPAGRAVAACAEQVKKTGFLKEAFFGPDTIEGWHLKTLTLKAAALTTLEPTKKDAKGGFVVTGSVGSGPGFEELMRAACEFNANVPVTGCEQGTEKDKVRGGGGEEERRRRRKRRKGEE